MKKNILCLLILCFCLSGFSQDMKTFHLYHPEENAKKEIANAVSAAKQAKKNVFIQVGGNWCIWCARFNEFITGDKSIDSLVNGNYIVYHMNYSSENKNEALLEKYKYPQRFGFPVFLILDNEGNLIHTQNSEYLESGKSYDKEKVMSFLKEWSPAALDPKSYSN